MTRPIRLGSKLLQVAETEARLYKRTAPKQIEYWAEIGSRMEQLLTPTELMAFCQGFGKLRLELPNSDPIDPVTVLQELDQDRDSGQLSATVTRASVRYETSQTHPGLLDRVNANGSRETGSFHDGIFTPIATS